MRNWQESFENEKILSPDRIVQAVLRLWHTHGIAGVSVRVLAQESGLPASSIYHHFGSLDHLFQIAQGAARREAEAWCASHIDSIANADLSPDAFPALLGALIDDWSYHHRPLAFAWRECQLLAARNEMHRPALEKWNALWFGFWQAICARCELSAHSTSTMLFFDGESLLHMMQWKRAVDRACLEETCQGWGGWLTGRLMPEGRWRHFARTEALRSKPAMEISGVVPEQIATAAAAIVAKDGVAALTHRAVAMQAGVSLGSVSYNFRTSADLLRAAYHMIFQQGQQSFAMDVRGADQSGENNRMIEVIARHQVPAHRQLAMDELLLAAARNPDLRLFSTQLRYLRGQTSMGILQSLMGEDRIVSPLDAALISSFGMGQRRASAAMAEDKASTFIRQGLDEILSMLGTNNA